MAEDIVVITMKKLILFLSVVVLAVAIAGLILGADAQGWRGKLLPLGMFAFAFIWMPAFLFYSYDRKQQRKQKENPDGILQEESEHSNHS